MRRAHTEGLLAKLALCPTFSPEKCALFTEVRSALGAANEPGEQGVADAVAIELSGPAQANAKLCEEPSNTNLNALDGIACELYDELDPPRVGSVPARNGAVLAVLHLSDVILDAQKWGAVAWLDALATAVARVERAVLRRAA